MGVITCHTRRSIAAYLFKPAACLRKSRLVTFDRSGRSADLSGQIRMTIDGGKGLHANKDNRHSYGCLSLLIFSAYVFKGSKPIRKSRNINDDVVCGRRAGLEHRLENGSEQICLGPPPFLSEAISGPQRRLAHPGRETRFHSSSFG